MSQTATITPDRQVTLPSDILSRRRWKPGDELTFVETEIGILMKQRNPLCELRGLISGAKTDRYRDGRNRY